MSAYSGPCKTRKYTYTFQHQCMSMNIQWQQFDFHWPIKNTVRLMFRKYNFSSRYCDWAQRMYIRYFTTCKRTICMCMQNSHHDLLWFITQLTDTVVSRIRVPNQRRKQRDLWPWPDEETWYKYVQDSIAIRLKQLKSQSCSNHRFVVGNSTSWVQLFR